MRCDPSFYMHPDRGYLAFASVHARQAFDSKRVDPIIRHCADQHLFNIAHVFVNIFAIGRKRNYRIPDDLPKAVVCDLASAVGFMDLNAEILQKLRVRQNTVLFGATS